MSDVERALGEPAQTETRQCGGETNKYGARPGVALHSVAFR